MSVAVSNSCWLHANAKKLDPRNPALVHAVESIRLRYKQSLAQDKASVRARRSIVYMDLCREKAISRNVLGQMLAKSRSHGLHGFGKW